MDGIDAALVEFGDRRVKTIASSRTDYPDMLRNALFVASREPSKCSVDQMGELHTWVGKCFRDAAHALLAETEIAAEQVRAIGSHGQTVRHQPAAEHRFTLQIGDASIIAAGTGIDTVADFRSADMAHGGEGAPLAPAFHEWLLRDAGKDRAVLNIGGIANITTLPADGSDAGGFDTGPGNTLLDAWIHQCRGEAYDHNGEWAASGAVDAALLEHWLGDEWFAKPAPKSTGFEYFNLNWMTHPDLQNVGQADVQATLVELSATSIADAIRNSTLQAPDIFVCGGGAHNPFLLRRLAAKLPDASLQSTAAVGVDPDNVEAIAFAWLARQRIEGQTGNLPAVTGARRRAILGALYKA